MKPTASKYMFVFLSLSTILALVTPPGSGAFGKEPSSGRTSDSDTEGASWAEPKMYETNEWSSRPQTPCEPAGSRVYLLMMDRINSRYLESRLSVCHYSCMPNAVSSYGCTTPRTMALSSTPGLAVGNPFNFQIPPRNARKLNSCPVP